MNVDAPLNAATLALRLGCTVAAGLLLGLDRGERGQAARRGVLLLDVRTDGPDESTVLGWLREAGFTLRERQIERHAPVGLTRLRLEGRYAGQYPAWSAAIVQSLSQRHGVTRVKWRDADA
jgi:hypothetical protein